MSQRIKTLTDATIALVDEITSLRSASLGLKKDLELHQDSMSQIRIRIEDDLSIIRQHRETMSILERESRESLQALQKALVSLSETLVEHLGGR
jgi:hypothetical protein